MNHFTPPTKEELIMSKDKTIYPMAFVPNKELSCKIHYIGFPKRWKEILLQIEKMKTLMMKNGLFPMAVKSIYRCYFNILLYG